MWCLIISLKRQWILLIYVHVYIRSWVRMLILVGDRGQVLWVTGWVLTRLHSLLLAHSVSAQFSTTFPHSISVPRRSMSTASDKCEHEARSFCVQVCSLNVPAPKSSLVFSCLIFEQVTKKLAGSFSYWGVRYGFGPHLVLCKTLPAILSFSHMLQSRPCP